MHLHEKNEGTMAKEAPCLVCAANKRERLSRKTCGTVIPIIRLGRMKVHLCATKEYSRLMSSRCAARYPWSFLRRVLRKSTSNDPWYSERAGMAFWPQPTFPSTCAVLSATHMRSSNLARPRFFQQWAPEAQGAAFASSVAPSDKVMLPSQKGFEEQTVLGKRRSDGEKQPSGLRSVAGIGPRNEQLLFSKGISSVDTLAQVFNQHKQRDEQMMLMYLQVERPGEYLSSFRAARSRSLANSSAAS